MYGILDIVDAIRFRWRTVAAAIGTAILLAITYLLIVQPEYEARASLIVDVDQPDPMDRSDQKTDLKTVMATQAGLVVSPGVAGKAARKAHLEKEAAVVGEWRNSGNSKPYDDWLKSWMLNQVEVSIERDSKILVIKASAPTADRATRIANGFAGAAVDSRYELRTEPAKAYANWLEGQVKAAQTEVEKRGKTLSDFVRQTGLAQGNDLSSEGKQLSDMAGQLAVAEARAASARQPAFSHEQGIGDAENSEAIQRLRTEITEVSANLAQLKSVYGPTYPEVLKSTAQLNTLNGRLDAELTTARNAFSGSRQAAANAERAAAIASEASLRALAAQQRQRLQQQGENIARYNTLQNEFVAAQQNYNAMSERLSKMHLQSEVPLTEVQVLDWASQFMTSRVPNIPFTLSLAALLGLILGFGFAILLEVINPRVRSWGGVERLLGARVIGRISLPAHNMLAITDGRVPPLLEGPAG